MSKFTVRGELRHATEDDYEKLRVDMEERGFSRLLPGGDGGKYLLPTAEYSLDAGWIPEQVLNTVKTVVAWPPNDYISGGKQRETGRWRYRS